jgi:DUF917 family protein
MQTLDSIAFNRLIVGSHFLGSGGGFETLGSSSYASCQLRKCVVEVLPVASLSDHDCIALVSFLGCAAIEAEKNHNSSYFERLLDKIQNSRKQKIHSIVSLGAGGGVPYAPIFLASCFNIPLLDADCSGGRCFPELQMMSTHIAGILPKKAFISNVMGDVFEIECNDFHALEKHARRITVSSGGACLIVPQILTGEEAKRGLIPGTLTKALTIGQIIQDTKDLDCEEACNAIVDYTKGTFWGVGGIISVDGYLSDLPHPFKKRFVIKNEKEGITWQVFMVNEYNLLLKNGKMVAEVPDIITLCDMNTRQPLTFSDLYEGRNVALFTTPAADVWYTEKGLALVRTQEHIQSRNVICGLHTPPLMFEHIA